MRILVAYEQRQSDEFEIRALAMAMAKFPKLTDADYEAGIVNYHAQPQQRRMKAGDVIAGAKRAFEVRNQTHAVEAGPHDTVPRPKNYVSLRNQFTQILREFKAQGLNPSNEELQREHARRVREQNQ